MTHFKAVLPKGAIEAFERMSQAHGEGTFPFKNVLLGRMTLSLLLLV